MEIILQEEYTKLNFIYRYVLISSRKYACMILTPLNPTFI